MVFRYVGGCLLREDAQQAVRERERVCVRERLASQTLPHREDTHVHGDSSDFGPAVSLDLVLVVGGPCLQEWLIDPPSTARLVDNNV